MIDDLDTRILEEIQKNPEATLQEIANSLSISKGTVRNRIYRMKEKGLIFGFKLRVSYSQMGFEDAFIGLDISPENFISALDEIKNFSFVRELYSTTGDHVAIAYVVEDSRNIENCVKKLKEVSGVRKVYPAFVQKIIK